MTILHRAPPPAAIIPPATACSQPRRTTGRSVDDILYGTGQRYRTRRHYRSTRDFRYWYGTQPTWDAHPPGRQHAGRTQDGSGERDRTLAPSLY
jgi:hypothetical protein